MADLVRYTEIVPTKKVSGGSRWWFSSLVLQIFIVGNIFLDIISAAESGGDFGWGSIKVQCPHGGRTLCSVRMSARTLL